MVETSYDQLIDAHVALVVVPGESMDDKAHKTFENNATAERKRALEQLGILKFWYEVFSESGVPHLFKTQEIGPVLLDVPTVEETEPGHEDGGTNLGGGEEGG